MENSPKPPVQNIDLDDQTQKLLEPILPENEFNIIKNAMNSLSEDQKALVLEAITDFRDHTISPEQLIQRLDMIEGKPFSAYFAGHTVGSGFIFPCLVLVSTVYLLNKVIEKGKGHIEINLPGGINIRVDFGKWNKKKKG